LIAVSIYGHGHDGVVCRQVSSCLCSWDLDTKTQSKHWIQCHIVIVV